MDREEWGRHAPPAFSEDGDQKVSAALAFPLQGATMKVMRDVCVQ